MNESLHPATPPPVENVIGEMELTPKTFAGARARALVGLTLAVSAFASITPTLSDTTVSVV
jgi:hypothetical protein